MPYFVYILKSKSTGRFYCGQTDNVERRVHQHNDPDHHGTKTTKRFQGPWELVWTQELVTRAEAMQLKRQVKKRGIGRFLRDEEAR
jgi:putative endonuclease